MSSKKETLKQQIEYYLGDANLTTDDFFRKEISSNKEVTIILISKKQM